MQCLHLHTLSLNFSQVQECNIHAYIGIVAFGFQRGRGYLEASKEEDCITGFVCMYPTLYFVQVNCFLRGVGVLLQGFLPDL